MDQSPPLRLIVLTVWHISLLDAYSQRQTPWHRLEKTNADRTCCLSVNVDLFCQYLRVLQRYFPGRSKRTSESICSYIYIPRAIIDYADLISEERCRLLKDVSICPTPAILWSESSSVMKMTSDEPFAEDVYVPLPEGRFTGLFHNILEPIIVISASRHPSSGLKSCRIITTSY